MDWDRFISVVLGASSLSYKEESCVSFFKHCLQLIM